MNGMEEHKHDFRKEQDRQQTAVHGPLRVQHDRQNRIRRAEQRHHPVSLCPAADTALQLHARDSRQRAQRPHDDPVRPPQNHKQQHRNPHRRHEDSCFH